MVNMHEMGSPAYWNYEKKYSMNGAMQSANHYWISAAELAAHSFPVISGLAMMYLQHFADKEFAQGKVSHLVMAPSKIKGWQEAQKQKKGAKAK